MAKAPAKKKAPSAPKTMIAPRYRPQDDGGVRRPEEVEMSAYRGAIDALDDFVRATGGIPTKNLDGELLALRAAWGAARAGVLERYKRFDERKVA